MVAKEKSDNTEKPSLAFNINKLINKFDLNDYNEDFIITNNILKHHIKSHEVYNYDKKKTYDKEKLDEYKNKIININNIHYYPYELLFNNYRNIYKEEKTINSSKKLKHNESKENEEKEDDQDDKDKDKDKEKEKEFNFFDEEIGSDGDYNFDYDRSEEELDGNQDNVSNVI